MKYVTANTARKDFEVILDAVVKQGDTVAIATDDGAAILIGQEEWNGMLETLYLNSIPGMTKSIIEGMQVPLDDCLDSVGWDIN